MDCSAFREKVNDLVDLELPQEERQPLQEHLRVCAECGDMHEELVRLKDLVQSKAHRPQMSTLLAARLATSRDTRPGRAVLTRRFAAAALLLMSIAGLVWFSTIGETRLTHAAASAGCVEEFQDLLGMLRSGRWKTAPASPASSSSVTSWKERVREEVRAKTGLALSGLPEISDAEFLRWEETRIAGVEGVRIDFRSLPERIGEGRAGDYAMVSVFVIPMAGVRVTDAKILELDGLHCCTDCVAMTGGNVFCFKKEDIFVGVVGNMSRDELQAHLSLR